MYKLTNLPQRDADKRFCEYNNFALNLSNKSTVKIVETENILLEKHFRIYEFNNIYETNDRVSLYGVPVNLETKQFGDKSLSILTIHNERKVKNN
jgi:hypothetical protein